MQPIAKHIVYQQGLVRSQKPHQSFKQGNFDINNFLFIMWLTTKKDKIDHQNLQEDHLWSLPCKLREKSTGKELRGRSCEAEMQTLKRECGCPWTMLLMKDKGA